MTKQGVFHFTVLLFVSVSLASAQRGTFWSEINGTPPVTGFYQTSSGRILAGTYGMGIYYSDNGGVSWRPTGLAGKLIVTQMFGTSDSLFAVARTTSSTPLLYRSTDDGRTWKSYSYFAIFRLPNGFITVLRMSDLRMLTALGAMPSNSPLGGIACGIFERADSIWQMMGSRLPFNCGDIQITDFQLDAQNNFYIVANGLYISTDRSASWKRYQANRTISVLEIIPSGRAIIGTSEDENVNGGIFFTDDLGKTWGQLGLTEKQLVSLAVDSSGRVLAGTTEGVYRYEPSTEMWTSFPLPVYAQTQTFTNVYTGLETVVPAGDLLVSAQGTFLVGSPDGGIFLSHNEGATWIQSSPRYLDIISLLALGNRTLLAGTLGKGLFRTTDEGTSWEQVNPTALRGDFVYTLQNSGNIVYAGTEYGLSLSVDAGTSWERLTREIPGATVHAVLTRDDAGQLLIGTSQGLYRSLNTIEKQWEPLAFTGKKITALIDHPDGSLIAVIEGDGVYISRDGGTGWNATGLARKDIRTLGLHPSGVILAAGYGSIFRSSDGGASWEEAWVDSCQMYSLGFDGGGKSYAGTYNGIFLSGDTGAHWERMDMSGLRIIRTLSLEFSDEAGTLYAGTLRGGIYRTQKSLLGVVDDFAGAGSALPTELELLQNFPNPFNPLTHLQFTIAPPSRSEDFAPAGLSNSSRSSQDAERDFASLSNTQWVSLKVYNILGEEVATLVDEIKEPGTYTVRWDAGGKPSGVYYSILRAGGGVIKVKKMLLVH